MRSADRRWREDGVHCSNGFCLNLVCSDVSKCIGKKHWESLCALTDGVQRRRLPSTRQQQQHQQQQHLSPLIRWWSRLRHQRESLFMPALCSRTCVCLPAFSLSVTPHWDTSSAEETCDSVEWSLRLLFACLFPRCLSYRADRARPPQERHSWAPGLPRALPCLLLYATVVSSCTSSRKISWFGGAQMDLCRSLLLVWREERRSGRRREKVHVRESMCGESVSSPTSVVNS